MENIKNFVNGITGADNRRKSLTTQPLSSSLPTSSQASSSSLSIPRADKEIDRNFSGTNSKYFGKMETTRNRTESESSNASMSSMSSNASQKDKDSYFWVM